MGTTIPSGFRGLPVSVAQLSLVAVLKCGQSFRWTALPLTSSAHSDAANLNVEYRLALKDRVICLRQTVDTLLYRAIFPVAPSGPSTNTADLEKVRDAETLAWLQDYFQLEVDLVKLYDTWEELDSVFGKLRSRFTGIRILRQDPWENLVS
jgi:N-glycosylase/DNA lyase